MNNKLPFYKSSIVMIMLFMFLVLVAATAYRIIIAFNTNPGLVKEDAFDRGEVYAQTLALKKENLKKGRNIKIIPPKKIFVNKNQKYLVNLENINLADIKVKLFFYRPANKKNDFKVDLQHTANGYYEADISIHLKGRWDILAEASAKDYLQRKAKKIFVYQQ